MVGGLREDPTAWPSHGGLCETFPRRMIVEQTQGVLVRVVLRGLERNSWGRSVILADNGRNVVTGHTVAELIDKQHV